MKLKGNFMKPIMLPLLMLVLLISSKCQVDTKQNYQIIKLIMENSDKFEIVLKDSNFITDEFYENLRTINYVKRVISEKFSKGYHSSNEEITSKKINDNKNYLVKIKIFSNETSKLLIFCFVLYENQCWKLNDIRDFEVVATP